MTDVVALLGPLDGARIAGGCDNCDAIQELEHLELGEPWD